MKGPVAQNPPPLKGPVALDPPPLKDSVVEYMRMALEGMKRLVESGPPIGYVRCKFYCYFNCTCQFTMTFMLYF